MFQVTSQKQMLNDILHELFFSIINILFWNSCVYALLLHLFILSFRMYFVYIVIIHSI